MKLKIENEQLKKVTCEKRWYSCSSRREEVLKFEIVEILSKDYSIESLCNITNISRSRYYKWLKTNIIQKILPIDIAKRKGDSFNCFYFKIIINHIPLIILLRPVAN